MPKNRIQIKFGPFIRDHRGVNAVMATWEPQIRALGERAAAQTGGDVLMVRTDRPAAIVNADAREQAVNGVLTRAFSSLGLQVVPRAPKK